MRKIKSIINGYFLYFLYSSGLLTDYNILSMVGQRSLKCQHCPMNKKGVCTACMCWIKAKVFSSKEYCPLGKWLPEK